MKTILRAVVCVSLVLGCSGIVGAVVIDPSMQFIVENETYTVNATMVFEEITISDTYIVFNDTGFFVSSPNSITIKLVYIDSDIDGAVNGEKVLDFYAVTTAGTVVFQLSGFQVNNEYEIRRNGTVIATSTASISGNISFSNAVWSSRRFQVYQTAESPVDTTPPVISGVTRVTSNPLDTDPSFGWVNVSCTVTDNVVVSSVMIRIRNPGGSWNNQSMTTRSAGNYYYRSTTAFSTAGNSSYSIRATDASGNPATSSAVLFSMPPNWEVLNDGLITVLDLVFISNIYSSGGAAGWVREDVDNDGQIQVFDMVLVSNHFGEEWW